ncbi:hypothetical protein TWF225_004460 [Orbilia oligospora]|nr:hypothetical protein TWF225_004460 [Orbilia oligospora]
MEFAKSPIQAGPGHSGPVQSKCNRQPSCHRSAEAQISTPGFFGPKEPFLLPQTVTGEEPLERKLTYIVSLKVELVCKLAYIKSELIQRLRRRHKRLYSHSVQKLDGCASVLCSPAVPAASLRDQPALRD